MEICDENTQSSGKGHREFLPSVSGEDILRRRSNFAVSLRKKKRDEIFEKKRKKGEDSGLTHFGYKIKNDKSLTEIEKIQACYRVLCENSSFVHEALVYLNYELKTAQDELVPALVSSGVVDELVKYLDFNEKEEIVREVTCMVCSITADVHEYTKRLVKKGFVSVLVPLISKSYLKITENVIWTLSNIMSDCEKYWKFVIDHGVVLKISSFFRSFNKLSKELCTVGGYFIKCASLYPKVLFSEDIIMILNLSCIILEVCLDANAIDGLCYLLQDEEAISIFFDLDMEKYLMDSIGKDENLSKYSVRALGNIFLARDGYMQKIMQLDVLDKFLGILKNGDLCSVKYCLWALSNISTSSIDENIDKLLNHEVFMCALCFLESNEEELRKESSYILFNASNASSAKLSWKLKVMEAFGILSRSLSFPEPEFLMNVLSAIKNLDKSVYEYVEASGCIAGMQKLSFHLNPKVKDLSDSAISQYFYGVGWYVDKYDF